MALRLRPVGGRVPVFVHVHKTGGQWTRHVLHQLGLDLCGALRAAGYDDIDLSPVMVVAPRNVTPPVPEAVLGLGDREGEYRAAVRAAEGEAYDRWYSV